MTGKATAPIVLTCVVALISNVAVHTQADPRIGTWKLNPSKSTNPGTSQSDTRTYEATPGGTKVTMVIVDARGVTHQITYTTKLDGGDTPVSGAPANFDTAATKLRDSRTLELTTKKGGEVVQKGTVEVSPDGKTMTQRAGTTVLVFDRQR